MLNIIGVALMVYYVGFVVYFAVKALRAAIQGRRERQRGQS